MKQSKWGNHIFLKASTVVRQLFSRVIQTTLLVTDTTDNSAQQLPEEGLIIPNRSCFQSDEFQQEAKGAQVFCLLLLLLLFRGKKEEEPPPRATHGPVNQRYLKDQLRLLPNRTHLAGRGWPSWENNERGQWLPLNSTGRWMGHSNLTRSKWIFKHTSQKWKRRRNSLPGCSSL